MRRAGIPVGVGTRFAYDGEIVEIVELHTVDGAPEVLVKDLRSEAVRRFALAELMFSDRARLLSADLSDEVADARGDTPAVVWSAAPEAARRRARERAAHVREILTGYRSGSPEAALPGEPRTRYRASVPMGERIAAKAKEVKAGRRTVDRWVKLYREGGEAALISAKAVQPERGSKSFGLFEQTALEIMIEHTDKSKPNKTFVDSHTRARIIATYGKDAVRLPSTATANRILRKLEKQHPIFDHSTKLNRDIAGRPLSAYGKLHPARPGEYLLMDTTRLDVFAMDPQTLRWVSVDLTVGMDWYSRCITGLRLTPGSTKSIDAAAVLYQSFRPMAAGKDWPRDALWPPHGVPKSVLVELEALDDASVMAATPAIVPETIVVDHGKIYVGEHVTSACRRMGISIQPARLRMGRDKGPVERFFRTVREGFLQELPGYKGPDVYSRGVAPEQDAYFYIDELEALLREWVATVYHRKPHRGIGEAGLWALKFSPAQLFEHGIARAGYLEAPRDPELAYQFLKVEWRTIQHTGVEIDGRIYRGDVLGNYVGTQSPYRERKYQWPIHVNPDDIRWVYFFDEKTTRKWCPLKWTLADALTMPFSDEGLKLARKQARSKYRFVDDKLALAELLERRRLSQGHTSEERRMVLRLSREQHSLSIDLAAAQQITPESPTDPRSPDGDDSPNEAAAFVDQLDEAPAVSDDGFYDDSFEDI
jgi:transposase InsO family protein